MAGGPLSLWNAWATQILVLLSLLLQIVLLLFAGIRRRESSALLRFLLWLAYLLADSTAIYALGHLALSSVTRDHKLVAFWAPFLLLHLGGPDNITAYALQDNELWLRHLQVLVVQVLGAGYVLYKRIIVGGETTSLLMATVLMFIVGLVKYCERTWALKQSDFTSIRSSVKELSGKQLRWYKSHLQIEEEHNHYYYNPNSDEFLVQRAHSLFHICKRGIVDSVINVDMDKAEAESTKVLINNMRNSMVMWKVMEMELSLMYDILYTKADVIHTWIGYLIRATSPVAIAVSFLMFHFSGSKDGQNVFDVIVTYILLGGALVMEMTSLLNALGSSWALAFLCAMPWSSLRHAILCTGRWHRLRRAVVNLRQIVMTMTGGLLGRSRKWSSTIGQFNLLYFRAEHIHATNRWLGTLATKLGCEDWWDNTCYSDKIKIPDTVKERAVKMVSKRAINTMGLLRNKWGELALDIGKYPNLVQDLEEWKAVDFHESVIIWHIATDLILHGRNKSSTSVDNSANKKGAERVRSIRAMSNYLMFLLVTRPDMLPGLPQNWLYQMTCDNLDKICEENRGKIITSRGGAINIVFRVLMKLIRGHDNNSLTSLGLEQTNQIAKILLDRKPDKFDPSVPRLTYAYGIAKTVLDWKGGDQLKDADPVVKVLLDLWTDFLIYAANRCNRESHAKKLNTGGEFITVVWLMIEHIYQTKEKK